MQLRWDLYLHVWIMRLIQNNFDVPYLRILHFSASRGCTKTRRLRHIGDDCCFHHHVGVGADGGHSVGSGDGKKLICVVVGVTVA